MYTSGFNQFLLDYLPSFAGFCLVLALVLVFGNIFWTPIKIARNKKMQKARHEDVRAMLLEKYKSDARFAGGVIYECATGYFLTIAETGYLEFNTPFVWEYVCRITDLNGVQLIKDRYSTAPNLNAAHAGNMMYGEVGALIGGLGYSRQRIGRISIMFKVNDFKNSLIEMKFIDEKLDTSSYDYELVINQTQRMFAQLDVLSRKYKKERAEDAKVDATQLEQSES